MDHCKARIDFHTLVTVVLLLDTAQSCRSNVLEVAVARQSLASQGQIYVNETDTREAVDSNVKVTVKRIQNCSSDGSSFDHGPKDSRSLRYHGSLALPASLISVVLIVTAFMVITLLNFTKHSRIHDSLPSEGTSERAADELVNESWSARDRPPPYLACVGLANDGHLASMKTCEQDGHCDKARQTSSPDSHFKQCNLPPVYDAIFKGCDTRTTQVVVIDEADCVSFKNYSEAFASKMQTDMDN